MTQKFRGFQRPPTEYTNEWATWVTSVLNSAVTSTVTLKKGSSGGDYSTTSTTYVDVDALNLALTVTIPIGYKLLVHASGYGYCATAVVNVFVSLFDSGTLVETSFTPASTTSNSPWALNWVIAGDGNAHTVKLQFKTANAADAAKIGNHSTLVPQMVFQLVQTN